MQFVVDARPQDSIGDRSTNASVHGWRRETAEIGWCRKVDSNHRPTDYESVALPTELFRRGAQNNRFPPANEAGPQQGTLSGYKRQMVVPLESVAVTEYWVAPTSAIVYTVPSFCCGCQPNSWRFASGPPLNTPA